MDFHVTLRGRTHLSAEVYRQLRAAVLDGRLRPGDSLPPTRELAHRLAVSRNTVTNAYQRLIAEGFLTGRVGAGTFVTTEGTMPPQPRRAPGGALRPRAVWDALVPWNRDMFVEADYDFRVGLPDPRLFPWDAWRRLVARQLRPARVRAGAYVDPAGHPRLREAIARHVGVSRSVRAAAEDVVVTSGAQQALDLVGRLLIEPCGPGTCVAVEDPGYPPVRLLFQSLGARMAPIPVDGEGIVVEALPSDARLVYVTPSHQFPLGMPMSLARRMALLSWAERHGAAVIEDDYDSEFRFDGRPLEPLQSLDRSGRVIYVGSFSKVLLPSLRLGFLVTPASLAPALREAKALADWHGPPEAQVALAQLIEEGLLARHIRRMRETYRERRERLADALRRYLPDQLALLPASAGLHVGAFFQDRKLDTAALARRAFEVSLGLQPLLPFYRSNPRAGLALGYGTIAASKIDEGVRRLAACLRVRPSRGSKAR